MENKLIEEERYQELLDQRDKPLTASQRRELREIERMALQLELTYGQFGLDEPSSELEEMAIVSEGAWKSLRAQQQEILTDEKRTTLEKLASFVPPTFRFG